jgi:hypothetical protein
MYGNTAAPASGNFLGVTQFSAGAGELCAGFTSGARGPRMSRGR